jgi:HEAT repeat protein
MSTARFYLVVAVVLALGALGTLPLVQADSKPVNPDEELLREAKVGTDGPGLLAFFRERSASDEDLLHPEPLIRQLGSSRFEERDQASAKLTLLGVGVLPALRQAQKEGDKELVRRATNCIATIENAVRVNVPFVAVRVLLQRRPAGTVEALLRYLPFARDAAVEEEIYYGLYDFVKGERKVPPALVAALRDDFPDRRALAGFLVGRLGSTEQRQAAQKLLDDKEPLVRLRAAQGLLAARDKAGIPALIALLEAGPVTLGWQAEELLRWAAGQEAPNRVIGDGDAEARKECRARWETWWQKHGNDLDLSQDFPDYHRPILFLTWDLAGGPLTLWGHDGRPRWHLEKLGRIRAVSLLRADRVLLMEERDNSDGVTERDLTGRIVWDYYRPGAEWVVACRRLPSGNTLIGFQRKRARKEPPRPFAVREIMPTGEVTPASEYDPDPPWTILFCPNGRLLCAERQEPEARGSTLEPRGYFELDLATGKWFKRMESLGYKDVRHLGPLPGGHFLVTHKGGVAELDASGQTVWQRPTLRTWEGQEREDRRGTTAAIRLRDGHTIMHSQGDDLQGSSLGDMSANVGVWTEVDRDGKPVAEFLADGSQIQECLSLVRLGFDRPPPADWRPDSVPNRVRQLRHKDPRVRAWAVKMLGVAGPQAEPAVPALLDLFDNQPSEPNPGRNDVGDALRRIGQKAIPHLVKGLKDARPQVRATCAAVLGSHGDRADAFLNELIEALQDKDWGVRMRAAWALQSCGVKAKGAVPSLVKALREENEKVAAAAARTLTYLGPDAEVAIPDLIQALRLESAQVAAEVARTLGSFGYKPEKVIPALIEALRDERSQVAGAAARSLGKFGPLARDAVPALLKAAKVKDSHLREEVFGALGQVGPAAGMAAPFLIDALQDKEYVAQRSSIASALSDLGPAADPAIPVLIAGLKHKSYGQDRGAFAVALGRMGSRAREAVPALIGLLKSKERGVGEGLAEAAARALGDIGPVSKEVVPALIEAVNVEPDLQMEAARKERVRLAAVRALGKLKGAARCALPVLLAARKEKRWVDTEGLVQTIPNDAIADNDERKWIDLHPDFKREVERAIKEISADR